MDSIPRPDFSMIDQSRPASGFLTPDRPPPLQIGSPICRSAENSPPTSHTPVHLSSADKKSLHVLLSLMNNFDKSVTRLMNFCEHCFKEKLTRLVIEQIKKHLDGFNELLDQIESQERFTQEAKESKMPSPVAFSISSWRNLSSEEWPVPNSNAWIDAAELQLKAVPPELPPSPKKAPLDERLAKAEEKRKRIENLKNRKIRQTTNKVRRANERKEQQKEEAITAMNEKQDGAAQRREALINQVKEKAHSEVEKAQETRFMQELEVEGRKLALERNMEKATQRYEEMVRDKSEKAKERTVAKSPESPSPQQRKYRRKPSETAVVDAISHNQWPVKDEEVALVMLPTVPEWNESEPKRITQLLNLKAKMERGERTPQLVANYMKAVIANNGRVPLNSTEGEVLCEIIEEMIHSNAPSLNQVLKQVTTALPNSFSFGVQVALLCANQFCELCTKRETLPAIKEMISLMTEIFKSSNNESKKILLEFIQQSRCLERICFVVESLNEGGIRNESVRVVVECVISFMGAIVNYLKKERDVFDTVISHIILPSFVSFLSIMRLDPAGSPVATVANVVKAIAVLAICRPVPVKEAVDEQNVSTLVQVIKVFLGSNASQIVPVTHELIILFGILARQSPLVRESCCWFPPPTVLTRLCNLPMAYFIQEKLSNILLPTLIACCIDSETNTQLVCELVNGAMLVKYMENMKPIPGDISSPQYRIPESRKVEIIQMFKQK